MALNAQLSVNLPSVTAGQTSHATLTVYNPNAVAVTVTGIELVWYDKMGVVVRPAVSPAVPPLGVGQPTSIAALGTQTFGPFALAVGSVAAASSFQMVPPSSLPALEKASAPPQLELWVGGLLYASDGSVNVISKARLLVSYTVAPPLGFQGGFAQFHAINNGCLLAAVL